MVGLAERALRLKMALDARAADPLRFWHVGLCGPALVRMREALGLFTSPRPVDELHLRACNKGTKTETCAAFVLACLRGLPMLDGIPLPRWRGPVEALCGVLDYKQQLLSVQPAYMRLLGRIEHKARYSGEILQSLRVRKDDSTDDEATWSVIHFASQENKRAGIGARADIVHFDEPPVIEVLRELRKAAHAGRPALRLIGETPTIRRQWAPLKAEYGDPPRRSLTRLGPDTAEVRWSLDEVAEWVLSAAERGRLERHFATDPLKDARMHGDYVDASGSCPFNVAALREMLAACTDPEVIEWDVTRESPSDAGLVRVTAVAEVKVWGFPRSGRRYYIPVDPSAGINDPLHDPGAIHVREEGSGDLMATHNGYLGSYGLGVLAGGLARQYNSARVDPERTGGWGEGVLRGLADAKYGNIARERVWDRASGGWRDELGFRTNHESRGAMVGAVQQWAEDWAAGIRYARCPSAEVIETLIDVVLDDAGKAVAAPGYHDEHMILWGQGNRRLLRMMGGSDAESSIKPEPRTAEQRADEQMIAIMSGAATAETTVTPGSGLMMPRPRRRPGI